MQILITGCYKSGTEYTTHLLNNHPNLVAKDDIICFMRFCYGRYDPIDKEYNYSKLVFDAAQRIRYRTSYRLNVDRILEYCEEVQPVTYSLLYDLIASDLFLKDTVHSWGDKTQLVWTKIPEFLEMFPRGKVVHVVRDPRNVMASFKKSTYAREPAYMGAVFNCFDSMKSGLLYSHEFGSDKYYLLNFEELLIDTEKTLRDIFAFLDLSSDHDLTAQESWVDVHGNPWLHNSSFMTRNDKNAAFDKQAAIQRWKKNLSKTDIALCEAINGEVMAHYGYKRSDISVHWAKMLQPILSDDTLSTCLRNWVCERKGIEAFPTDPLQAENWGEHNLQ